MNYVVHESGSLLVEALNEAGEVVGKSQPIGGDAVDAPVAWDLDPDLNKGVVKLRFSLKNADVYSIRFQ